MSDISGPMDSPSNAPPRGIMARATALPGPGLNEQAEYSATINDYTMRDLFALLGRHKLLIFSCVCLLTLLSAGIAFVLPERYVAESLVILDTRRPEIVQQSAVLSNLVSGSLADPAIVRSEVAVISSPAYARRIIERLDLMHNPTFLHEMTPDGWTMPLRDVLSSAANAIRSLQGRPPAAESGTPEARAVTFLSRKLSVYNDERSYAIRLRYESRDPEFAALIVNTVAQLYISDQLATKQAVSRRASEWLKQRLAVLQAGVNQNEHIVSSFEEQHHLATVMSGNLAEQQMHDLNMQLMAATSDRARKEAALTQVQAMLTSPGGAAGATQVLASPLIQKLREQEADAAAQMDPRGDFRAQEIGRRINAEIRRVTASLAGEVDAARSREDALRQTIAQLQTDLNSMNGARIRLRDLERDATASRAMYDSFLLRAQQVEADEQSLQADARIVPAETPITPSFPNKPLLIGFGLVGSLFVGVFLAFVADRFDESLRTREDAERLTGAATLGMVPFIRNGSRAMAAVITSPLSPYSDALHNILVGLRACTRYSAHRVIAVSSSLSGEGKTVFATTLARAAAKAQSRTLLIDCDMRRPAVGRLLAQKAGPALDRLYSQKSTDFSQFTATDDASGMHYLSTHRVTSSPQEILGSRWMVELIAWARTEYDMIVLDTPPVLTVSDALLLSQIADATVLVVRWGRTPVGFVNEALRLLQRHSGGPVSTVLSMVSMKKYLRYRGAGYYYRPLSRRRLTIGRAY